MRGEPAQPNSAPVKEEIPETATATASTISPQMDAEMRRMTACSYAEQLINPANPQVETFLADAKKIEAYLKGEAE